MTKQRELEGLAMGIFSGSKPEHGEDPNKPWEVSDAERERIRQANDRAANRMSKEAKGAR